MKISIIVPIYKVEYSKLRNCIDSLLNQTYKNIEVVLVDDGSPDECPIICDEYKAKDDNVVVIHQKNKGLSGARNSGVKACTGDYYTFVDGDDFLIENAIEILANNINNKDVDVLCTQLIAASKVENINNYPYEFNKIYSSTEDLNYLRAMLLNFNGNNNSACGKLYSSFFTKKNSLYHNEKLKQGAEDLEFNFRIFSKAKSIMFIPEKIYQCVYNAQSITRSFNIDNEYLILDCLNKIRENINDSDEYTLNYFYNRVLYVIVNTAISGFFNPTNTSSYKEQKKEYKKFLNNGIFKYALKHTSLSKLDFKRKIIILLIKNKVFFPVKLLSVLRFYQKKVRCN